MEKLSHYRAGLYLSFAAALATCLLYGLIFPQRGGSIIFCEIVLLIPFGLWLQSSLARYGRAALMRGLNLLAAGVLVFSEKFGVEFAEERKHHLPTKFS